MNKTARFIFITVVVGIFIIVVGTTLLIRSQRARTKNALAKYKVELRAKGEKLTWEELGFPRSTETNQNLDLLVAAVDKIGKLEFEPSLLMNFVGAGRAQVCWLAAQPPANPSKSKGTNLSWNDFTAQFETNTDSLKRLREAVEKPPTYFCNNPADWFLSSPKPPFVKMRDAAQLFSGDAMVAVRAGQHSRAQADIHAIVQLALAYREDFTLLSQMIRSAIAGLGLEVTWEALQAPGWSEKTLTELQKDWEALDLSDAVERGITGERALMEFFFKNFSTALSGQSNSMFSAGQPLKRPSFLQERVVLPLFGANMEANEHFVLQHYQARIDSIRKLPRGSPWPTVDVELRQHEAELKTILSKPLAEYYRHFTPILIPNISKATATCIRHETQRRLTVSAIAVERYRLRHGRLPQDLETLVPQFISAVPLDPMSGKPLCYRHDSDGTFTLYSAGEDGRDDGGDPSPRSATNRFDLWSGKDAVWPMAEPE